MFFLKPGGLTQRAPCVDPPGLDMIGWIYRGLTGPGKGCAAPPVLKKSQLQNLRIQVEKTGSYSGTIP